MMKKYVHIVFGDSAAGTLKYFFKINGSEFDGRIFRISEDYSIGPLSGIDTEKGLEVRMQWLKEMLKRICADDYLEFLEKDFMNSYEKLKALPEDSEFVIWHCNNASDQTGLRYLCSLLGGINLNELDVSIHFKEAREGIIKNVRAMGECSLEEIKDIITGIKRIDVERCAFLAEDWERIRTSKKKLRIVVDGCVIGVEESYFDDGILSNCSHEFKKAPRVVGKTMGEADQLVSDAFIDYRLRNLIDIGEVEYRGVLRNMRDFEVRLPEKL